jgi:hypothetical protein
VYDDDHLYPYTIENELHHSMTLTYDDFGFGKVTNVHDNQNDVRVDYAFYTGRGLLVQTRSELTDSGSTGDGREPRGRIAV